MHSSSMYDNYSDMEAGIDGNWQLTDNGQVIKINVNCDNVSTL